MSEIADRIRHFWFELWNHRAVDEMREAFHPDYHRVDHRRLTESGTSRSDWEELTQSWWEVAPDAAAVEFEPLAEKSGHIVYYVLFGGHDAVSGGPIEVPFYVVNEMRGGRFLSAHVFEDRDAALACFVARTATS